MVVHLSERKMNLDFNCYFEPVNMEHKTQYLNMAACV